MLFKFVCRSIAAALFAVAANAQGNADANADALARMKKDVEVLAGTEMAGRGNGQGGLNRAIKYVADSYKKMNLNPKEQGFSINSRPNVSLKNVIVAIRGTDPALRSQYIVIGAHLDHLGTRHGLGREPGAIFPGADDNASGTAAVMELARHFQKNPPRRSLLFIHFTGEEWGLWGSRYWTANPTVDIKSVRFMLNLDMIGRLGSDDATLTFTGMGMGPEAIAKAKTLAPAGINIEADRGTSIFAGASDHAPFAAKNIPTCFLFTGIHADYHKPTDTADKINWGGLATITQYAKTLIAEYAYSGEAPEFKPMADIGLILSTGKNARAWRVAAGGSAETAGIVQGDLLTFIDGHEVGSQKDLERILDLFSRGDSVKLRWNRGGKPMEAQVALQ
jgi:hypothetical protein